MAQPQPPRPNREHSRVPAGFPVRVLLAGQYVEATARDVSMTGLFLDRPLPVPDRFQVRIPLPGQDREVETTCRVERREPSGVALSFARIDWEDLLAVARYLSPRI